MKYKKYIMSLILLFVIIIGAVCFEFENDTFYSIKIGEDIFKYGIDFIDHHSFFDLSYSYPHIIFDSLVYLFYSIMNFKGLYLLTIIFTFIFCISLFFVNNKLSKNFVFSLFFTLLSIMCLKNFFALRAQIFSMTIFLFQYYFLYSLFKEKKKLHTLFLFLFGVLLVNTHVATYPFFLIMFIPFIIASKFRKDIVLSFILCCLCGFVSFMGIDSYTYLVNTLLNNTMYYIEEHQPLILAKLPFEALFLFIIMWMFGTKKIKLELYDIIILVIVVFMSFSSVRHILFLNMFTLVLLCKYLGSFLLTKEKKEIIKIENFVFSVKGFVIVFLFVSLLSIMSIISYNRYKFIDEKKYPVDAAKYIKDNIDYKNVRIFNDINIGSYLMLNDIPVFIDSRTDLYTYTYNHKRDIFNDYVNVLFFNKYYEDIFSFYDIDYVLMSKNQNINVYLNRDTNYDIIYEDDYFVLFERNVND